MKLEISYECLNNFAFTNYNRIKSPKRILIFLHGLEVDLTIKELARLGKQHAQADTLFVYPFTSSANWMNQTTVEYIDEILSVLLGFSKELAELPIICYGGSMGGHGALLYTIKSRFQIAKCIAICPVCDLSYHIKEHPTLINKFYFAYANQDGPVKDILDSNSPICLIDELPDIHYLIVHCENDTIVSQAYHSDVLVEKMRNRGLNIKYNVVSDATHCKLDEKTIEHINCFIEY